jgi:uncharacterized phage-associated protein
MTDTQADAPPGAPLVNSAVAVASWLIEKNQSDPSRLSHLKLQKLLYFAQGWHLAILGPPFFGDSIYA